MKVAIVYDTIANGAIDRDEKKIREHRQNIRESIQTALESIGHITTLIEVNDTIIEQIRNKKFDIAFNISCGNPGESRQALVPLILDWLSIPYTGSGPLAHMVALDKPMTKRVLQSCNVQTPRFQVVSRLDNMHLDSQLRFPLFVKPVWGGCSLGVADDSLVYTEGELTKTVERIITGYHQPALIEDFVEGREVTVGILGNDNPIVLPILEFDFENTSLGQRGYRTFETKMVQQDLVKSICPAQLSSDCISRIMETALATYRAIGCCDFARVDIRLDVERRPQVLEVNSLPGLAQGFGSFTQMAWVGGMTYDSLIEAILMHACERYRLR